MMYLQINETKCQRDGLCAAECPAGLITMQNGRPTPVEYIEQACFHCGHCVAVCPHDALSLQTMPLEESPALRENWKLTPEQVEHFLKGRRSIRLYKQQDVERDVLAKAIDIARYAPTGHNTQSVQWRVMYDRQRVQEVASATIDWMRSMIQQQSPMAGAFGMVGIVNAWERQNDLICRNAPHLVIAHAPKEDRIASSSATIALTYLELAALPLGLGTCWAGFVQIASSMSPAVAQTFRLPENHVNHGVMMIGYPQMNYHRIPMRKAPLITWDSDATA